MSEIENKQNYYLHPGFIFVSRDSYLIHTVLGSCVSVCLWDSSNKFGGMNHYVYSYNKHQQRTGKYGEVAIPHLINLMLKMGSKIDSLKAHIVGGGKNTELDSFVGTENAALAEKLLNKRGIEILTKDVHGEFGRKVIFNTLTGEILIYKIHQIRKNDWFGTKIK